MRSVLPFVAFGFAAAAPAVAAETIPVGSFRQIEVRGGGNVIVRPGPVQRVTIVEGTSRSTRIAVDNERRLQIDTCYRQCPSIYRLRVIVETPAIHGLAVMGGGAITAAPGFRQSNVAVAVRGGGIIDVRQVAATNVAAAVTGGGQLLVRPQASLAAAVRGGGEIRYWGNPRVASAINGGGTITRGR